MRTQRSDGDGTLVISVEEKPSIQDLERSTGYVETDNGKIVRGFKSTYRRHGTLDLFAALGVATAAIHTKTTERKKKARRVSRIHAACSNRAP